MKPVSIALFAGIIACASVQPFWVANAVTYNEKVLWSFGSGTDGLNPSANLIAVNGILYGTTQWGGSTCEGSGCGSVFSLDPSTGKEKVLHAFDDTDGSDPRAGLIKVKGSLYSTTIFGGTYGLGTVFSFDPGTGTETVLHSFGSSFDGYLPVASLIHLKGKLFGTTDQGGPNKRGCNISCGTVFSLNLDTGAEQVLHTFCSQQGCADGANPLAGLIDVNGTLYGTTQRGGVLGRGTVFAVDPKTGIETVVHSFCSQTNRTDGEYPGSGLIAVNGTLYGTTVYGGDYGKGTIFALDPNTGSDTVLHSFGSGTDGSEPVAGLIDVRGTLYGTTSAGGTACSGIGGCGTAFSFDPGTSSEIVLYSFAGSGDGEAPWGSLIHVNGTLYGTTIYGGHSDEGTVFALMKK